MSAKKRKCPGEEEDENMGGKQFRAEFGATSRSGRARKKSSKLIEMEEEEDDLDMALQPVQEEVGGHGHELEPLSDEDDEDELDEMHELDDSGELDESHEELGGESHEEMEESHEELEESQDELDDSHEALPELTTEDEEDEDEHEEDDEEDEQEPQLSAEHDLMQHQIHQQVAEDEEPPHLEAEVSPTLTAASGRSGRARKKSAKVIEMEEAELLEKEIYKKPKAPSSSKKSKASKPAIPTTVDPGLVGVPGQSYAGAGEGSAIKYLLNAPMQNVPMTAHTQGLISAQNMPPPPPDSRTLKKNKGKKDKGAAAAAVMPVMAPPMPDMNPMAPMNPMTPLLEAISGAIASEQMPVEKPKSKKKSKKESPVAALAGLGFAGPDGGEVDIEGTELDNDIPLVIDTEAPPKKPKSPKKDKKSKPKAMAVPVPISEQAPILLSMTELLSKGVDLGELGADGEIPQYANTDQMAMKLMTSTEKKATKTKGKKKEVDPSKPKKKRAPTAYMLWCNHLRPRVVEQNPGIDFATISKRLGELWQSLPEKDKMMWRRKAKKAAAKGSTLISTGKTPATSAKAPAAAAKVSKAAVAKVAVPDVKATVATSPGGKTTIDNLPYKAPGLNPIDVSAHLKLLGESLALIGTRLQEHQGQIAVQGSLSVLLDSMLCALGPLACLTNQVPELNVCQPETHAKTLDNIAYFMPGIG